MNQFGWLASSGISILHTGDVDFNFARIWIRTNWMQEGKALGEILCQAQNTAN